MIARSWTVSSDAWPGLGDWANDALLMAERADQAVLSRAEDAPEGPWYRGHCFTAGWHLQWRRLGASVRAVGMGPVPLANEASFSSEGPAEEQPLSDWESEERSVVLWGKRQPGEAMWLELRIPNIMEPPTQHPEDHEVPTKENTSSEEDLLRRVLHLVTYRKPGGGPASHRYVGLGYARSDDEETTFDVLDHPATA